MDSATTPKTPLSYNVMLAVVALFCVVMSCVFAGFAIQFALSTQILASAFLFLKSIGWLFLLRCEILAIRGRDLRMSKSLARLWLLLTCLFALLLFVWVFMGRWDYVFGQLTSLAPIAVLALGHRFWLRRLANTEL